MPWLLMTMLCGRARRPSPRLLLLALGGVACLYLQLASRTDPHLSAVNPATGLGARVRGADGVSEVPPKSGVSSYLQHRQQHQEKMNIQNHHHHHQQLHQQGQQEDIPNQQPYDRQQGHIQIHQQDRHQFYDHRQEDIQNQRRNHQPYHHHHQQRYNHQHQETQAERLSVLHKTCSRFSFKLPPPPPSPPRPSPRPPHPPSPLPPHSVRSRLFVSDRHSLLYCEVPKAGCTNWKRVLMLLEGRHPGPAEEIATEEAHAAGSLVRLASLPEDEQRWRLQSYTRAMFVREPMERLVSAYRDKLQRHNTYYQSTIGRAIISRYRTNASSESLRSGRGVTFLEFARFLLDPVRPGGSDPHWEPANRLCLPCQLRYDFVGKLESVGRDAATLLRRVGAPKAVEFPRARGPRDASAARAERYMARLSPATRGALYASYYRDYAMFGYPRPVGVG